MVYVITLVQLIYIYIASAVKSMLMQATMTSGKVSFLDRGTAAFTAMKFR